MKVLRWLLLSVLMIGCLVMAGCGEADKEISFGTAGSGGKYFAYGNAMADMIAVDKHGYKLNVKTTAGAAANLRLLSEQFLDLAIVQSDILSDVIMGKGNFIPPGAGAGYAAVAGLYTEACQIIVPADSEIKTVNDLADKRVSVGEKESGALKNAEEILFAHGLNVDMLTPSYLSFADSADAMARGEIDAFFCTAGAPTKAVEELAAKMNIRLLSISPDIINNIMKAYKGYTRCTIPAGTYPNQTEEVTTLGVKAVLVASSNMDNKDVEYITNFVLNNAQKLRETANVQTELTLNYAVEDIPYSFHAGAANFYKSKSIEVEVYSGSSGKKVIAGQD